MHAEVGPFILLDAIDRDWLGEVHRAFDTHAERVVRLRLIAWPTAPVDRQALMALLEGWRAGVAALDHPNIGAIRSVTAHGEVIALAGDWAGAPLSTALDAAGPLPLAHTHRLMAGILLGLGRLHRDGLVHGTLSPAAIHVDAEDTPRLCEAGLQYPGRFPWLDHTVDARWPHGLSPEELAGEAPTARSDLHGAGMLLHRMLTGRPAFEGAPSTVMQAILTRAVSVPSIISPELGTRFDAMIARATALPPHERFASASEFLQALNAVFAPPPLMSTLTPTSGPPRVRSAASAAARAGTAAPNPWPPDVLERITCALAEAVGPMAKILVTAECRRATGLTQLASALASRIDDVALRNRFLEVVRSEVLGGAAGDAVRSNAAAPPAAAHTWPPAAEVLARLKSGLAAELGPMAGLLVDRAAAKATSRREFIERLSSSVPGLERRTELLGGLEAQGPGESD